MLWGEHLMLWDTVIATSQLTMLVAMVPTMIEPSRWPHKFTCYSTGGALLCMAVALWNLDAVFSAVVTALLGAMWLAMAIDHFKRRVD